MTDQTQTPEPQTPPPFFDDIRNVVWEDAVGQTYRCEVLVNGSWLPFAGDTTSCGKNATDVYAAILDRELTVAPYTPPSRETQLAAALAAVDAEHAGALRHLTGGATIEERGTWKTKEEAARAMIGGSATSGQSTMIGLEAAAKGLSPEDLAQVIIAKAEAYQTLIGLAAALKAEAKTAVTAATSDDVPLDDVATDLQAVFAEMKGQVDDAIASWKAQNS